MTSSEPESPDESAGTAPQNASEHGIDPESDHPDVAGLGYERARDELAEVVKRLEAGGLSLEDSLALWERGEALAKVCERHLAGARQRVDQALAAVEQHEEQAEPGQ
ncbi:Exodeoxyribonuclease VII small subunit [Actinopolyspora alba]|uniref:Exodeoxyribonuclease 7 small subunit n=1 Tax=Actinopolyspora alba TaxID=673379 RepID=A0A1I1TMZ7_9ACTN|nr:exodeoxyribonuclease VII small subunit [Actinopolyspora alba]SFD60056.1 Exodeoxyribonuclease VII small subunit [Actinopolyspora alba]